MSVNYLNRPFVFDWLIRKIRLQPIEICQGFHNLLQTVFFL